MRHLLILFVMIILVSCVTTGASVTVGTGGGYVVFSVRGDMLETAPGEAYSINRNGLESFLAGDYATAEHAFETTLSAYPNNPDATYYLGLTRIHQGKREEGFALLLKFRDPNHLRVTQNVRWWAEYCRKKPEMTADDIQKTMNKARSEGLEQERQEALEENGWY